MEEVKIPISLDDGGFEKGARRIIDRMENTQREVSKTGMTVDDFSSHMRELHQHFDKLAQAIDKNTDAIGKDSTAARKLGHDLDDTAGKGVDGFNRLEKAALGFFTLQKSKEFVDKIVEVRSEMESLRVSFETLAGEHVGRQLYEDIKQFATSTPMMMNDLAKGAQTLLGFNIEAEKVMPILKEIGDISMGDAQKFNSLTLAFAQMSSTGKLMGQDLLQMINAGFNPLVTISEKTGKSVAKLKKEMSEGKITVEMVEDAFKSATSEGGKFNGMLEKQSKTLKGQMSNLKGAYEDMLNTIGEQSEGVLVKGIDIMSSLVKNYEKVGQVLLGLIATYGTYRAAVMAVSVAEGIQSGQIVLKIRALRAVAAAQELLNKTMLNNPYVLATMAVVGLTVAIYKAATATDAFDEAQERLNDQTKDNEAEVLKEMTRLEELNRKLQECEKGSEEYKNIKQAIINQYGRYYNGLDAEIEKVGNLSGVYDQLTEAIRRSVGARNLKTFYDKEMDNYDKTVSDKLDKAYNVLLKKYGKDEGSRLYHNLYQSAVLGNKGALSLQDEEKLGNATFWTTRFGKNASDGLVDFKASVNVLIKDIKNAKEASDNALEKYKDMYEITDKQWTEVISGTNNTSDNSKKTSTKELSDKEKNAALKAAKEKADADAKQIDEELRYQEELRKIRQNAADARRDAEIASIKNDGERERAEREAQHEKTIRDIEEQEDDIYKAIYEQRKKAYETANKGKHYENTPEGRDGAAGVVGSLTAEEQQYYNERYNIISAQLEKENAEYARMIRERYENEKQQLIDYMKEYGSIQQQREAITQEYDNKIAKESDSVQKAALQAQKERLLKELDEKEIQQALDWETIFNNMNRVSTDALRRLRDNLRKTLNEGGLTPENAKVIADKLLEAENEISNRSNFFASLIPALQERVRLTNQAKVAEDELVTAQKRSAEAINKVLEQKQSIKKILDGLDSSQSINVGAISADMKESIFKMFKVDENSELGKKLSIMFGELIVSTANLGQAEDETAKATQKLLSVSELLKGFKGKGIAGGISDIINNAINAGGGGAMGIINLVNSNIQSLPDLMETLDLAGTEFGEAVGKFAEGTGSFVSSIQSFASGDFVGGVNNILKGISSYGDMFGLWGDSDKNLQRDIERLTISNEVLKDAIDNLADIMEDADMGESMKLYEDQLKYAREAMKNTQEMMSRSAGASKSGISGTHSSNYRIDNSMSSSEWKRISDIVGKSITSASQFFNLTSEEMYKVYLNASDLYAKIKDRADDGYKDAAQYMDDYIQYWKQIEELQTAYYEKMTSTSFDSVRDSFKSAIMDMDSDAESMAKNFEEYMKNAIFESLMLSNYDKQLKEWYEGFAKAMESGGEITESEQSQLRQQWDEMVADGLKARDELYKTMGWSFDDDDGTTTSKEYFESLRDMWSSTLMDMEADAKSWSKEITRIIVEDLINSNVLNEDFNEWLEQWKKDYTEAIQSGDEERLNALRDSMVEMRESLAKQSKDIMDNLGYADMIKEVEDDTEKAKGAFDDLHSSFLSTLTDMNADAKQWSENITKTMVEQLVERNILNAAFDEQMDSWRTSFEKAVEAGDTEGLKHLRKELENLRGSLAEQAKEYMDALGYVQEVAKDTTFKDMTSDFASNLMDLDATAEDWAESIGRKMAEKIIEEMVAPTLIQPYLDDLQKAFNNLVFDEGANLKDVLEYITPQVEAAKQAFEDAKPAVDAVMSALGLNEPEKDLPFSDLRSTFLGTLTDMEADAEKFGKEIKRTLIEQMIDKQLEKQFREELDKLNNDWADALEKGDSGAIENIRQQMVDLRARASEAVKPLIEDLKSLEDDPDITTPLSNLRSNFLNTLTDMESDTEDFAKSINEILTEAFIDKFVLGEGFDQMLKNWEDEYAAIMGSDVSESERAAQLQDLKRAIGDARDEYTEQARAIQELMGITADSSAIADQEAHMNMADKATYDQFELYLGIATAQQIAIEQGNDVRKQILSTLQAMSGITSPNGDTVKEIRSMLRTTNEHLYAIKLATEGIRQEFMPKLQSIDNKLSKL